MLRPCLHFWRSNCDVFPRINSVARVVLTAVNWSSALERTFSIISDHLNKTRNRIHLETLEKIVQRLENKEIVKILEKI
jgi:mannitol/fructose-specific phosphotransferase system IIA component (Ntr-type)